MSVTTFVLQSLAAAGFQSPPDGLEPVPAPPVQARSPGMERQYRVERPFTLAGHRSHSSHRSHGSHRSSSGSVVPNYSAPRTPTPTPSVPRTSRNTDSTPPSSVLPSSPSIAPGTATSKADRVRGNSHAFKTLVMQVQLALFARGYYSGTVDGIIGPETKAGISRFQSANGLPVTGTLSDGLLDALNISP